MENTITKKQVFDRIGKEIVKEFRTARKLKELGEEKTREQTYFQILGLQSTIEVLGFDWEEFKEYYEANRAIWRKELKN